MEERDNIRPKATQLNQQGKPIQSREPLAPQPLSRMPGVSLPPRPPVNSKRAEEMTARRDGARQIANDMQSERPRPVVRPAAAPVKFMPKTPPPQAAPPAGPANISRRPISVSVSAPALATFGLLSLNTAAADQTISAEVSSLQSSLDDLRARSAFSAITAEISTLGADLNRVLELLESARREGYRYQADLEKIAYDAVDQWERVHPQVLEAVQVQARNLQSQLASINPMLQNLNMNLANPAAAGPLLRDTQTQVNRVLDQVSQMERDIENTYDPVKTQVRSANGRLTHIHWALDQLKEARFKLAAGEDLVLAVPTRWDMEGKNDPEGVLYLSNKRLVFERKEKVATKKILFITTASELVQEVLIDQPLANLRSIKADNKGLFGHQDYLLVDFPGPKPGPVSFHINGQESKDWAAMVERAQSGQIDAERVNASGGLSVGDLTGPLSPADILNVQNEVNNLQDEMMLKSSRQGLSQLENDVRSLERKLAAIRARGYEIEKDLEADLSILSAQWERIKANSEKTLDYQAGALGGQMQNIQQLLAQVAGMSNNPAAARPQYLQLKSAIASAEAQADAAQATVLAQFDQYADEVESLDAHLAWVDWMLDALSTASFRLLATECGVAAVEAVFQHPSWEPENGILFLTDQRLLWEDRVGTFELKVEVPLQAILDVKKDAQAQDRRDVLAFQCDSPAPVPLACFLLSLPVADDWLKMVGRARSGGYARDRAIPLSAEEVERVRNAPQQCAKCGAAFTAPLLRGQTEIRCEYCGLVTRL